jgi:hypothetical protein
MITRKSNSRRQSVQTIKTLHQHQHQHQHQHNPQLINSSTHANQTVTMKLANVEPEPQQRTGFPPTPPASLGGGFGNSGFGNNYTSTNTTTFASIVRESPRANNATTSMTANVSSFSAFGGTSSSSSSSSSSVFGIDRNNKTDMNTSISTYFKIHPALKLKQKSRLKEKSIKEKSANTFQANVQAKKKAVCKEVLDLQRENKIRKESEERAKVEIKRARYILRGAGAIIVDKNNNGDGDNNHKAANKMKVLSRSQLVEQELRDKIEQLEGKVRSYEEGNDKADEVLRQAYAIVIDE